MSFIRWFVFFNLFIFSVLSAAENPFAESPFEQALNKRDLSMLSTLFKTESVPNNCLKRIVDCSDIQVLKTYLTFRPGINQQGKNKNTLLHYAATSGSKIIIDYLIAHGADETCRNVFSALPCSYAKDREIEGYLNTRVQQEKINQKLAEAVSANNVVRVQELLKNGASATAYYLHDSYAAKERTLLHCAAASGFCEIAKELVNAGADAHAKDSDGFLPIHLAADHGHVDMLSYFATMNVSLESRTKKGDVPITLASEKGYWVVIKKILEFLNSDINLPGRKNNSAVHCAVNHGDIDLVCKLLNFNARINIANNQGDMPIHLAVNAGLGNIVSLLLNHKASISSANKEGFTPLLLAARCGMYRDMLRSDNLQEQQKIALRKQFTEIAHNLIQVGANVNETGKYGNTALHWAVLLGMTDLVNILIHAGADIKKPGEYSSLPLHLAAATGDVLLAGKCIEKGTEVNVRNKLGQTPLHLAVDNGHASMIEFLLNSGARVDEQDIHAEIPLHVAVRCGLCREEVCILLEKDFSAARIIIRNYMSITHKLLQSSDKNHILDRYNNSPLHWVTLFGENEIVKLLLNVGLDKDVVGEYGSRPLHLAALCGYADVVSTLLEAGALADPDNDCAQTPLFLAVSRLQHKVVPLLIKAGANPFKKDMHGRSAKMIAHPDLQRYFDPNCILLKGVCRQNIEMIRNALKAAPRINVQDDLGNTPLHLALMISISDDEKISDSKRAIEFENALNTKLAIVLYLLQFAEYMKFDIKNNSGKTVIDLALENGMLDCIFQATYLKQDQSVKPILATDHSKSDCQA